MASRLDFSAFHNVIDGNLSPTEKMRYGTNPSTLEANPASPLSTRADVDRAVAAAKKAYVAWSQTPLDARKQAVVNFAQAILKEVDGFAEILTREQGRPFMFAKSEVQTGAQWLIQQAAMDFRDEEVYEKGDKTIITRYVPLGVTVGMVPWNSCGKIAPALITGNVFIMKPSPFTPYCGLKLCELAQAFFPPGVFQCLSGDDELGPMLTQHDEVNKISFTGSTEVGRSVMRACSETLKRVTLELGGNDAAIVLPDVDIPRTAVALAQLSWFNSGQVCVAVKRIYVHESIYSEFLQTFTAVTQSLVVGDGFAEGTTVGPISNLLQYNRVRNLISDGIAQGLAVIQNSKVRATATGSSVGYFVEPVIVNNPPDASRVVQEEQFGPVVPLLKWNTEEEVIQRANATNFGLGASVWSSDKSVAQRIARRLEAGTVWINSHMQLDPTVVNAPFKHSGLGVEYGLAGMRSYCNVQSIHLAKA
ncbi:aldehyde dehydrogenase [Pestalotiopsis sp. NC0098]|nr:aldehyde dehydrogenase [Pestalotiopsis sp. NC0098]